MSDLISRQALREAMYEEAMVKDSDEQRWDGGCWIRYKMFERVIDSMPTIDAVPVKHGKWIRQKIGWKCSNCTLCTNDKGMADFNYCPNCGAKMAGIDE